MAPLGGDDAANLALKRGVDGCLHKTARPRLCSAQDLLNEVRREHGLDAAIERQTLGARFPVRGVIDQSLRVHAAENEALSCESAARRRRPLRQRRQPRRLRDRQLFRRAAKVTPAGAGDADGLLAVRREVDVQREDLALRVAMFESQRHDGLAHFRRNRARRIAEQHLRDLLGDRRAAFDRAQMSHVVHDRPRDRDRVDAQMVLEAAILGSDRGRGDVFRNDVEPLVARTGGGQRLVQNDAVAVDDGGRGVGRDGGNGAEADP